MGVLAILLLAGAIPLLIFATMGDLSLIIVALVRLLSGGLSFLAAWKLLKMKKGAVNFFAAYTMLLFADVVLQVVYQQSYSELLIEAIISVAVTYYVYTLRPSLS